MRLAEITNHSGNRIMLTTLKAGSRVEMYKTVEASIHRVIPNKLLLKTATTIPGEIG
jgi:hypothetical protein